MTVIVDCLVETKYAEDAETTQYTSTGIKTIIDKFTGYSAAGGSLAVALVPSGGTVSADEVVVNKTFLAGETYTFPEVVGHTLAPGDFVSTNAGAATTVVIRMSGRKVSGT